MYRLNRSITKAPRLRERSRLTQVPQYNVKQGLTALPATGMVAKSRNHVTMMTGNPRYTGTAALLTAITAATDALETAIEVALGGGTIAFENKRMAYANVLGLLRELAWLVQDQAKGDKNAILSSGFGVRKKATPVGELPAPLSLNVRLTGVAGRVSLTWESVYGADLYHVYRSADGVKGWELCGVSTKGRRNIDGLISGQQYFFAVTAIGTAGESTFSDVAKAFAA